ncbi:MAG: T9SS type A sorting domain-containing protein, partial [bacterium]
TIKRTTTGISSINEFVPIDYKLYNNFPNPFNPSTNINFDLPKSDFVNLILYDISGKEVMKLINETLPAGSYKYILNAGNLNSGAYFVKLQSKKFTSVIKIILIK